MILNERLASSNSPTPKANQFYQNSSKSRRLDNIEKLQNSSISSSVSSSSSATNSSTGNVLHPTIEQTNSSFQKQTSASPQAYKKNSLNRHSSSASHRDRSYQCNTLLSQKTNSKEKILSERFIAAHVNNRIGLNPNYASLSRKPMQRDQDSTPKANSYTFNTYDPSSHRLSSYDNNDLLQGYLTLCNDSAGNTDQKKFHRSQDVIIADQEDQGVEDTENGGILPVYAKRATYLSSHEMKKGSQETSSSYLSSSSKKLKASSSNSNLFARALNYAFKKNPKSSDSSYTSTTATILNATWKSKLGKYLSTTTTNLNHNNSNATKPINTLNKSNGNSEGCDLDMGEDLSATYHLSRRHPLKKQTTQNKQNEFTGLAKNNFNSNKSNVNSNPSVNHVNSNQLFLCLSSSSSSSTSNNSTPASFEAQTVLGQGESIKPEPSNNDATTIPSTKSSPQKRTLSQSKSNSQKLYELTSKATSCVGQPSSNNNETANSYGSTNNRSIINNGFNSLRKMLKISTPSGKNDGTKIGSSKKTRNKCLSASTTPLPSCLAPNQFGNSYTDSQNSAYSSAKVKTKGKKNKCEPSPSFTRVLSKLSLNRQQSVISLNSTTSTPKSSKKSLNPSHLTKSIINQTSSSFSSASLSSTNYTHPSGSKLRDSSPHKQSYHLLAPINQASSHTSLTTKAFRTIGHCSPDTPIRNKYNYNTTNKSKTVYTNSSLKPRKEYKSEKCLSNLPSDHKSQQCHSQKKMLNMLKVYKNVLNKMQKSSDASKKIPVIKASFQPPKSQTDNKSKLLSDELILQSFAANKIMKAGTLVETKISPVKILTHESTKQIRSDSLSNSLKNVNRKAKLTKISPEEEIMCDLEVASYFDDPTSSLMKKDETVYECEEAYYYEDHSVIVPEIHNLDDDSKNLEVLVRQLAAEAALSTLNDRKLGGQTGVANENDYMKSFNDIFGKVNEQCDTSHYLYKNKTFNNFEMPAKASKTVQKNCYVDNNKRLVYDLIEDEFSLNDDDYHLINQLNEQLPVDNNSLSDEYNARSSESLSPPTFKLNEDPNNANKFNYKDEVDSLFKSNTSSSYEIDTIENWLDNLKLQQPLNKTSSFKNGFMSLKAKPQRNHRQKLTSFHQENYLHSKKRSSSSTSFQPVCNFLKIIEKPAQPQPTRTNSITIDINGSNEPSRLFNKTVNDNAQIKIEKKIRLNYHRPQNLNSILNFGTLC